MNQSSWSAAGRRDRPILNREGDAIDTVLVIRSPECMDALLGLVLASNSRRMRSRPPWRNSRKTSADDMPPGWMWRQIFIIVYQYSS
jgi:hypothetical protein